MSANERLSLSEQNGWAAVPDAYDATLIPLEEVPEALRATVQLESSVTAEIAARFGAAPDVAIELEGTGQPLRWEADLLALDGGACCLRHVSLAVGDRCIVQARSLAAVTGEGGKLLRGLGTRPLGGLLFETQAWRREGPLCPAKVGADGAARFGRVSLWRHTASNDRLLVAEYFTEPLRG